MKVKDLIKELENLNPKLLEKEISLKAPNGLKMKPYIKYELEDWYKPLDFSIKNIKSIVLDWEG